MPDNKPPLSDNRRAKVGDFLLTPYERVIIPEVLRPWSISTAVRSPDRLRGFLSVLTQMEGREWNLAAQTSFQIRLIQARLFGDHKNYQFCDGLPLSDIKLINGSADISYRQAKQIFARKNYKAPAMRGRRLFKPLEKLGFASLRKGCIHITATGKMLLAEDKDYGDIFLRAFLKWQLPNPLEPRFSAKQGYNIKPFVGVLRLIAAVNRLCAKASGKQKGISFDEFRIFAMTLIDWRDIQRVAEEIIQFRRDIAMCPVAERDAFVEGAAARLRPNFRFNSRDIYDSARTSLLYFRMTNYIHSRDLGYRIILSPVREIELKSLFARDSAAPIANFADLDCSYAA